MLTWITLGLVIAKYVLDYVAPRTKTKADDTARDVLKELPLPSLPDAINDATKKGAAPRPSGGVVDGTKPVEAPPVSRAGFEVRDHR